jgi:hypothetical protein
MRRKDRRNATPFADAEGPEDSCCAESVRFKVSGNSLRRSTTSNGCTDLTCANLRGANLSGALLLSARTSKARLAYADLTGVTYAPAAEPPDSYVAGITGLSNAVALLWSADRGRPTYEVAPRRRSPRRGATKQRTPLSTIELTMRCIRTHGGSSPGYWATFDFSVFE